MNLLKTTTISAAIITIGLAGLAEYKSYKYSPSKIAQLVSTHTTELSDLVSNTINEFQDLKKRESLADAVIEAHLVKANNLIENEKTSAAEKEYFEIKSISASYDVDRRDDLENLALKITNIHIQDSYRMLEKENFWFTKRYLKNANETASRLGLNPNEVTLNLRNDIFDKYLANAYEDINPKNMNKNLSNFNYMNEIATELNIDASKNITEFGKAIVRSYMSRCDEFLQKAHYADAREIYQDAKAISKKLNIEANDIFRPYTTIPALRK